MKIGDRIEWGYEHSLNSRSRIYRVKKGVFVRKINTRPPYPGGRFPVWCLVKFDGNKTNSRVLFSKVKKI